MSCFRKIIPGVIVFLVMIDILLRSMGGSVTSNIGYDAVTMLKYTLIDYPTETIESLSSDFANLRSVNEEDNRLRRGPSKNPPYKAKYINEKQKNVGPEKVLGIKASDDIHKRARTKAILHNQTIWDNEVTIDKGSKEGTKVDMAVENTNGVVGKIKSVSAHTNVVKSLTNEDKLNSASIKIPLDEKRSPLGILQSYDVRHGCYIVLLLDDSSEIRKGMQVVTSDEGGGYPNGPLTGIVDSVQVLSNRTRQTIYTRLVDDFQTFSIASVIIEKGDEQIWRISSLSSSAF